MNLELKTKSRSRFLYLLKDGQLQLITSSINTKLKQEALLDAELNVNNIVKGKIANKGKVRGKVKHISINNWQKDIDSFQKGDILIAKSTKAEYLPAMEKAAAFVTDEGGITCHAAIVAREMKKPCVIGTKIATRIFKDGDMVEVDADAGIVKKID